MGADGEVLEVVKMPETPQDLLNFLEQYKDDSFCTLERVGGMPGNGGSAMFNFGKGYGHLQMALLALHIPTEDVTPNKWEKTYQLGSSGKYTRQNGRTGLKPRLSRCSRILARK